MARELITSDNYSPIIHVITWLLLIISALVVFGRGLTKLIFVRKVLNSDDWFISISFVFSIGQSAATSLQASNGAGKPLASLNDSQKLAMQKAQYAAQLLYVASLLFSRLAVLGLLDFILAHQKDKWKIHALGIFIVAWSAVAELVFAFECRLPHPWKYIDGHCFSRDTWFNAFDAISILIDLSLIVLPTVVIWHVRTSILKRLSVISFFATRVIVVIASICDIVFWDKFGRSSDPTLHGWPIIICTQTIQCLSIIAACVLFLKPFLETLESGFIRSDNLRRRGSSSVDGYGNYNLSKVSKRTAAASRKTLSMALGTHNSITAGEKEDMTRNSKRDPHDWDASSQNSQSHIIRKDRTFNVTFSPAADSDQRGNRVD